MTKEITAAEAHDNVEKYSHKGLPSWLVEEIQSVSISGKQCLDVSHICPADIEKLEMLGYLVSHHVWYTISWKKSKPKEKSFLASFFKF